MHFHLPKPLHGWRALVGEVGIIVLGVIIALAFEQAAERIHWSQQVYAARAGIHREMTFDLAYFADRLRVAPCLDRDLAAAQQRIDTSAATGSTPSPAIAADSPGRLLLVGDYEAQQSAQNLVHFARAIRRSHQHVDGTHTSLFKSECLSNAALDSVAVRRPCSVPAGDQHAQAGGPSLARGKIKHIAFKAAPGALTQQALELSLAPDTSPGIQPEALCARG